MAGSESQEMYLKTILLLRLGNQTSRSVDVANELGYSKASVSRAVSLLKSEKLIEVVEGGEIVFTKKGKEKALSVLERYNVLVKILKKLGLDEEEADEEACKLEHVIGDELYVKLKEFSEREDD
ncbi:MAG: metal-dependent transcriptional regulator [Ezakiella sp.]|uniref:metal-dependent transcriptional regulator n=1 Tax=Ezakiella sp. TaxID=1935205 RepID=UPI002977A0B9|nr:metal-dependent transcriptional regulator [Ezakiella sp.]MDD7731718.1 metal-dependent transcriptional regulator [Eubacteriales bacterium]MDY6079986.1 metal-dependent transcriptional regulator [Ezakiella sp.]